MLSGSLSPELRRISGRNFSDLCKVEGNLFSGRDSAASKALMMISCSPREGRTICGASMAVGLQQVRSVVIVDADLHRPRMHDLFTLDGSVGLVDVIQGGAPLDQVLRATELPNLFVLPAGRPPAVAASVLSDAAFPKLLSELRQRFDFVVVDTPPLMGPSDAAMIARHMDGALLVLSCGSTRWEVAQIAQERVKKAGGEIVGAVMNQRRYFIPRALYRFL